MIKRSVGADSLTLITTFASMAMLTFRFLRLSRPSSSIKTLDNLLSSRTFLVGNALSKADLALLSAKYAVVSKLPAAEQYAHLNLTRYFSHISYLAAQLPHGAAQKYVPFEPTFEGQPAVERKDVVAEKKREKENKQKANVAQSEAGEQEKASGAESVANVNLKDKKQKEKKEKSGKSKDQTPAVPATPIPSQIDLRVGKIVDVQKHPDADSLYLEKVDFGEPEGPRTVLSGLVHYVPMDQMKDRWVVGICNLKPASMRGIKSHAMLLCATHKDGKEKGVEPILPPEGSTVGEKIYVEGFEELEPDVQLNPKKKVFETIQPGYTTTLGKEAAWVGPGNKDGDTESRSRLIRTSKGVCVAPNFTEASLS